jgi:peptidoglycan/LPS O-acetylase OafA/YrhL
MKKSPEITDLTICRAAFAAWVFAYHVDLYVNFSAYLGPFAGLIRRGYLGVDGFFILSGLILTRVHPELFESTSGAAKFLGLRLARIYPVHLATIGIFAALLLAGLADGQILHDPARFSGVSLLENLALVQGWGVSTVGSWNYPSWSVSTEWAGYLLFPLFAIIADFFDVWVLIQLIVVSIVLGGFVALEHHNSFNTSFSLGLLRFFPEFILGIVSARLVPRAADYAPILRMFGAGVIITVIGTCFGLDELCLIGLWLVLFTLMLQADAERPPLFGRRVALRWLGQISYAFYMSFAAAELIVTRGFAQHGWVPGQQRLAFTAAMLVLTLIIATALHLLIEVPCRRLADRRLNRPVSL